MRIPLFLKYMPVGFSIALFLCTAAHAKGPPPAENDMGIIQILEKSSTPHPYASHLNRLVLSTMGAGTLWGKYRDPEDGRHYIGHDSCRPCHYDRNRDWIKTKMASAMKKIADFKGGLFLNDTRCISCHTTGYDPGLYNGGFDEGVGFLAGVQCEACHGAGSLMVEKMDRRYITRTTDADLCGRCHSERYGTGFCFPEYDEWKISRHRLSLETLQGSPLAEEGCLECHSVDAIAPPSDRRLSAADVRYPVTCQACHAAMVLTYPEVPDNNQLRLPKQELCQSCHSERKKMPDGLPHAPQAEMMLGRGGAEFPGEEYQNGPMNADIPRGCLTCHALSDRSIVPAYQGHTFLPNILVCRRCHPDLESFNRKDVQRTIRSLITQLGSRLKEYPSDGEKGEFYRMALFNYTFVQKDRSFGIHNTDYARKLLVDSIRFLNRDRPGKPDQAK